MRSDKRTQKTKTRLSRYIFGLGIASLNELENELQSPNAQKHHRLKNTLLKSIINHKDLDPK